MGSRSVVRILVIAALLASCGSPSGRTAISPSGAAARFDGTVDCPPGEKPGDATWDYGPNAKGDIDDPVGWIRRSATGLDPGLTLTLVPATRDGRAVVTAARGDSTVLAFVEFGRDGSGRYLPLDATACPSSGIQDFNG